VLLPSQVKAHLKQVHEAGRLQIDRSKFEAILKENEIMDGIPEIQVDEVLEPFEGIQVKKGWRCHECSKVYGSIGSMEQHYSKSHKSSTRIPKDWPSCFMQRLTNCPGEFSKFFEVHSPNPLPPLDSMDERMKKFRQEAEASIKDNLTSVPSNARTISPWLMSTKWHLHVEGLDTSELLKLIAIPEEKEFPGLKKLVLEYMERATDLIRSTMELSLQRLNTPDPIKGYIQHFFFFFFSVMLISNLQGNIQHSLP
jgi:hypothetical protein